MKWEDKKYVHSFDGAAGWEVSCLGDLKGNGIIMMDPREVL